MSRKITRILVANRGEIACRVFRTCREMGIATVAVASDVDLEAPHARMADQLVEIGPASPLESYLRGDIILDAARQTGADAIHPGYGFLAENAGFSRACAEAGIVFIGPSARVIEAMGEKTAARKIMAKAGVPVVPGEYLPPPDDSGRIDPEIIIAAAARVGFPLLVKAAYGGGGKGMRLVFEKADLIAAAEGAVREAIQAFGNGLVYLERYLENPRHIEFQIFGDNHGGVLHLGERECSIQRRHQKIIEETPSTALDPELRSRMEEAAVEAAKAVEYTGAGTVEFLLDRKGEFYFLEMNTRLQVEHPITEWVNGVDLVRAQITVAEGEALPWTQEEIQPRGHAIECRIYAEDPASNFMPSLGRLQLYREPQGPGVRVDSGVCEGGEVTMHYDPMIAKLSVHAQDRPAAIARMRDALRRYAILGITTNGAYLDDILAHVAFHSGATYTSFLETHFADWHPPLDDILPAAAAVAIHEIASVGSNVSGNADRLSVDAASPWRTLGHFRLNGTG